ncbi:tetratricopeptide repeat protein [Pinirhizobacter sp.]|jgi:predicted negative regulator of RcsB-dependent stress response|uniref:YfgM family protein n=1 Tax=Pinirhizobacter sp. TaxID=2950432 RepID=UPI002F3F535F
MSFDSYDDYEQGERIQQWLRQNGVSIIVGIVLGLLLIFGYQKWKNHRADHEAEAATLYEQVQVALATNKSAEADASIDRLQTQFTDTTYAVFASADRARVAAEANQLDKAQVALDWAQAHATDDAVKGLVQLRAAQVRLASGHADQALSTLDTMPKGAYISLAQELRGDALVKLGRIDEARKAYTAAMASMDDSAPQRGVVKLKIDDLAVAGKQGA